jgi:hypothetical protein
MFKYNGDGDLPSSGILSGTDVSAQLIGPIFNDQEIQFLTLEDGTDILNRNDGKEYL